MLPATWVPLSAFAATLVTCWWLLRGRAALIGLDHPNERSLHQNAVPRTGGIAIHAGILCAWILLTPDIPYVTWVGLVALVTLSLLDDLQGLPVALRLFVHVFISAVVALHFFSASPFWFTIPIATMVITWMANLYNFMDGSDGLAGGMTFWGFGFYGAAAYLSGDMGLSSISFSVAASAAAFLLFNFYPARVFMGDSGSVALGYLAGTIGIMGWARGNWTWWFPLLVFSPIIVDASITLARRTAGRVRIWQAHRDHYYQRLVQLGWGHRRTALAEYGLMTFCGAAALAGLRCSLAGQLALLLAATMLYVLIISLIEIAWRKHQAKIAHEA